MTRDLTGYKNGLVTGVQPTKARSGNSIIWECICDCGHQFRLPARELVHAKSLAHPGCTLRKKIPHPLYSIWRGIISRCEDKKDKNYGGRGITVCAEWRHNFMQFVEDIGPRPSDKHSVDRRDVKGNYCKENCQWTTSQEQSLNQRVKKLSAIDCFNIFVSKLPVDVEAANYGVSPKTIRNIRCHQYSTQVRAYIKFRLAKEADPSLS